MQLEQELLDLYCLIFRDGGQMVDKLNELPDEADEFGNLKPARYIRAKQRLEIEHGWMDDAYGRLQGIREIVSQ